LCFVLRSVFSRPNLDSESIYNQSFPKVRIEYNAQAISVINTAIANPVKISRTISNHVSYYRCIDRFYFAFVAINHRSAFFLMICAKHKMMLLQVTMFFFPTLSTNKAIKSPPQLINSIHFLQDIYLLSLVNILLYSCTVQLYPHNVILGV